MKYTLFFFLLLLTLTNCAFYYRNKADELMPPLDKIMPTQITGTKKFLALDQEVWATPDGGDFETDHFLLHTELTADQMVMLGFTTLGRTRFDIAIDRKGIQEHGHSTWLSPRKLASDQQLILWPLSRLQQFLPKEFTVKDREFTVWDHKNRAQTAKSRVIRYRQKLYSAIHYATKTDNNHPVITLSNHHDGYTLKMETLHTERSATP